LRRSITYLQSASRLSNSTNPPTEITTSDIQEIAGVVPDHVVYGLGAVLGIDVERDIQMDIDEEAGKKKMKGYNAVRGKIREVTREGYSAAQILLQVR
jgi:replication factor C subunit 2/4